MIRQPSHSGMLRKKGHRFNKKGNKKCTSMSVRLAKYPLARLFLDRVHARKGKSVTVEWVQEHKMGLRVYVELINVFKCKSFNSDYTLRMK